MSTMFTEPIPLPKAKFFVHGFGTWSLPPLHLLESAGPRLLAGDYGSVLMEKEVPIDLVTALQGSTPADAARFFFMWVVAGFDFEAAYWGQVLSLHRTLPDLANVAPGYEDEDCGEPEPSPELAAAAELHDYVEDIASAVLEHWALR